jgi:formylmethanofuran dehydrogenase subunit C
MDQAGIQGAVLLDCKPYLDDNGVPVSASTIQPTGNKLITIVNFQGDIVLDYDGVAGFISMFEATGTVKIINMNGGGGPIIYGAGCRVLGDPTDISGDLELFGDCLFQPNGAFWATTIINTEQVESAWAEIDGVYYDPIAGESIVLAPDGITYSARIGLPDSPAVNLTDAQTILAARNLKKLYLSGARVFVGTQTGGVDPTVMTDAVADPFKPFSLIGWTILNVTDGSSGAITTNDAHTITVGALVGGASNQWNPGDQYNVVDAAGNQPYRITFDTPVSSQGLQLVGSPGYDVDFKIAGNLEGDLTCQRLINEGPGMVNIHGNCHTEIGLTNSGGGNITILGKLNINGDASAGSGSLDNTGGAKIVIGGDAFISGAITNTTGTIFFLGNLKQGLGFLTNGIGVVIIDGTFANVGSILNSGNLDINGDCFTPNDIGNLLAGTIHITGNVASSDINNFSTGDIIINGNAQTGDMLNTSTGNITIWGNLTITFLGNLTNSSTGIVAIHGATRIYGTIINTGTLTYHNVEDVQAGAKTIDLNQIAGNYDLFTGTLIPVVLESLVITMPNLVAGGALTGISIQTDDATPQAIISAAQGLVANLTAENQLYWTGKIRIGVGKKIQLTIAGGATGVAYVCDVDAQYKGVTAGGILA